MTKYFTPSNITGDAIINMTKSSDTPFDAEALIEAGKNLTNMDTMQERPHPFPYEEPQIVVPVILSLIAAFICFLYYIMGLR